jgi:hypothetical protein
MLEIKEWDKSRTKLHKWLAGTELETIWRRLWPTLD